MISRDEALALLAENHVQAGLLQHSIGLLRPSCGPWPVNLVKMKNCGLTGLLHDVDYPPRKPHRKSTVWKAPACWKANCPKRP